MKAKPLFLAIAALLAAGGLWFAWSAWRATGLHAASTGAEFNTTRGPDVEANSAASMSRATRTGLAAGASNGPTPRRMHDPPTRLAPPVPNRRFTDFTPEERVGFARKGHGPGG